VTSLSLLNVVQTGIFERLSATFNETEIRKGRVYVWKWKKLKNVFKCPLVNETLWPETETFGFHSETRPRPSHTLPRPRRLKNTSRDRDVETETTTLVVGSRSGSLRSQMFEQVAAGGNIVLTSNICSCIIYTLKWYDMISEDKWLCIFAYSCFKKSWPLKWWNDYSLWARSVSITYAPYWLD